MRPETPQAKEPPAPAYAADPAGAVPPLSAREKWAQETISRWKDPALAMTDAETKELDNAWWVEIERRARLSDLGIVKSIPAEESDRRVRAAMRRWRQERGL